MVGEARNKKRRFLADHPYCCFCGGEEAATTVDHIPARTCFPDRAYPHGFEFPACERCQRLSRLDELAFGFYVRLADQNDENFREDQFAKVLAGVKNNLPHLLPSLALTPRDKRRSLRDMGLSKPPFMLASELPLAAIPAEVHDYIQRYSRKLACALFYREQGRAARADHQLWTLWAQATDKTRMDAFEAFVRMTP